jgi:hypothetical protein
MTNAALSNVSHISPQLREQLNTLCEQLSQAGGANISAVILYGGLARGHYRAGVSDINLLLLLEDPSIPAVAKIAPVLHATWRAIHLEPYVVGTAELGRTVEDFPTRFWDIQRNHVTLLGNDPFPSLSISPQAIRLRIEQELRNLAIRLRRRFILVHDDPAAQERALSRAVVPLAVSLAALLHLSGRPTKGVFAEAATVFALDPEVLAYLKSLRKGGSSAAQPEVMFDRVVAIILRTADLAVAKEPG